MLKGLSGIMSTPYMLVSFYRGERPRDVGPAGQVGRHYSRFLVSNDIGKGMTCRNYASRISVSYQGLIDYVVGDRFHCHPKLFIQHIRD